MKYNQALDYLTLAAVKGRKGQVEKAAALFAKAMEAPDLVRAIATLEANNKAAFQVEAAVKAKAAKKVEAKAKAQKVVAAEDDEFDEDGADDLLDTDGAMEDDEEDEMADDVEASTDEEDEEDEEDEDTDFTKQFASVLASMTKKPVKAAAPAAKKPAKK